jgi:hypothetical protein
MEIQIADTTMAGEILNKISIAIENERTNLAKIIKGRVTHEVKAYNQKLGEQFYGLVQPSESEKVLNGYKMKKRQPIDAEKQVYIALEAFNKNAFFVLVDDQQVDELETELLVSETTNIHFMKLTQLVGG